MAAPKYIIDGVNGTSSLEIYVANVLVTTYSYDDTTKEVTLSERPNLDTLDIPTLEENTRQILIWINAINNVFSPNLSIRHLFDERLQRKENRIIIDFECEETLTTHAIFKKNTQMFEFDARPEVIIPIQCFIARHLFLMKFLNESKTLN